MTLVIWRQEFFSLFRRYRSAHALDSKHLESCCEILDNQANTKLANIKWHSESFTSKFNKL